MNPVAALSVPLTAVLLAGNTVTVAPVDHVLPTVQAGSAPSRASDQRASSVSPAMPDGGRSDTPSLRSRWAWPLQPRPAVVRPFLRPATKYGAGHRGVDLAGAPAQVVLAVEAGTVTHVGRIAGRGTVTVLHSSGIRSTYEPVDPLVATGSAVSRGASLGRLEADGSHCGPAACLHLGAIRGAVYLDPMVYLMGGRRVRLLPLGQAPEG